MELGPSTRAIGMLSCVSVRVTVLVAHALQRVEQVLHRGEALGRVLLQAAVDDVLHRRGGLELRVHRAHRRQRVVHVRHEGAHARAAIERAPSRRASRTSSRRASRCRCARVISPPRICSGAMYFGEPMKRPACVRSSASPVTSFTRPKSSTLTIAGTLGAEQHAGVAGRHFVAPGMDSDCRDDRRGMGQSSSSVERERVWNPKTSVPPPRIIAVSPEMGACACTRSSRRAERGESPDYR